MRLILTLLFMTFGLPSMITDVAHAAGLEDLDSSSKSKSSKNAKADRSARGAESEVVREIVKGYFFKANAGTTLYLGSYSSLLQSGTTLSLSGGGDFIDRENMSMAWEISFDQALHNGLKYTDQGTLLLNGQIGTNQLGQGDLHTFSVLALVEASWYVNRRFGIGIRGGGGVMLTPLLMFEETYKNVVIPTVWNNQRPSLHDSPHPLVGGGPTIEYYTKLSHFSIGADVNAFYAIGFDLGLSATGYLKYTF